jgi:hypothetical protein
LLESLTYAVARTIGDDSEPQLRKEFTVKPGEVLDLSDIHIGNPKT